MLLAVFEEHRQQMEKFIGTEFAICTYKRYLSTKYNLEEIFDAKPKNPEGIELDKLLILIEAYEAIYYLMK